VHETNHGRNVKLKLPSSKTLYKPLLFWLGLYQSVAPAGIWPTSGSDQISKTQIRYSHRFSILQNHALVWYSSFSDACAPAYTLVMFGCI